MVAPPTPRRPMPFTQICEQVRLGRYRVPAEVVADAILARSGIAYRGRTSPNRRPVTA